MVLKKASVRLTKRRLTVLNDARKLVEDNPKVKFVYADLNCRLQVHPSIGPNKFFTSCEELKAIVKDF